MKTKNCKSRPAKNAPAITRKQALPVLIQFSMYWQNENSMYKASYAYILAHFIGFTCRKEDYNMYKKRPGELSPQEASVRYNKPANLFRQKIAYEEWPIGYMVGNRAIIEQEKADKFFRPITMPEQVILNISDEQIQLLMPAIAKAVAEILVQNLSGIKHQNT
jgi:hypothetical protein